MTLVRVWIEKFVKPYIAELKRQKQSFERVGMRADAGVVADEIDDYEKVVEENEKSRA